MTPTSLVAAVIVANGCSSCVVNVGAVFVTRKVLAWQESDAAALASCVATFVEREAMADARAAAAQAERVERAAEQRAQRRRERDIKRAERLARRRLPAEHYEAALATLARGREMFPDFVVPANGIRTWG